MYCVHVYMYDDVSIPFQSMSVAVEDSTVYGPRSMLCASPLPPDFEEMAKREGESILSI